ncbi:MAG TPA: hypothetical protein VFS15_18785 [Kofleriaceae bacterium]|nr:hypothetical protein [Kofleriaceae bacterium]
MKALLTIVLVAACGCPQKPAPASGSGSSEPTQPAPNQGPTQAPGSGSATQPSQSWPAGGPGIGENCGPNDTCAQGLTCVSYYGIAGPRGPQFKSCEIKCQAQTDCPAGTKCVTIADGPGQVCRK